MHTYMCLSSRRFLIGGLSGASCLEGFVRGGFCPSPLLSECIHYKRKRNITLHFRFHRPMYENFSQSVTSHALEPSPLSQTVTPSRTPSPSSVTYFMDGP